MAAGEIPKNIKASLYIDGKPAVASLKSIEQEARKVERELKSLEYGTEAWNKKLAEVQENRRFLQGVRDDLNGVGGAFGRLRQELGQVGQLAAGYLGFQFITAQFQNIIAGNAKLSDSLADVRRVTGLTEAGVLNLDASLGKLDTRTSKADLRGMAIIAGKLGVAKTEILSFVEATDKLTVALGDELGNADQITTTLGKILNVFDGKVTGDNITTLGNAMVKLANDGVASAGFISDFTQRVSGIAKTAGLSLPATMAFGAGIEELGGRSESAATAMQKLLLSISSDTPKAAKIAGVSLKDYTSLLSTAPEQALLKYTRGLVANKNAFTDVTKSLDDAGEEGARTIETITKLGQNTEFFSGKIKDATFAIGGYNEINEAFNLKNQTLGAQLEKVGKEFNSLGTNRTLVNFLSQLIFLLSDSIKWFKANSETIALVVKSVLTLAAGWMGYRAAALIATLQTTAISAAMAIARTASLLYALAVATLTGNTTRAAAAQRLLGVSMAVSPFGAVLAIVASLTAAYALFSSNVSTAARIQESLNDVRITAKQRLVEETDAIQKQINIIKSSNSAEQAKFDAINKLRAIMPDHLKGYDDIAIKAGKATGAIKDYVSALEKRYLAEAAQERKQELRKENIALETADGSKADGSIFGGVNEFFQGVYSTIGYDSGVKRLRDGVKQVNKEKIAANKAIISEIDKLYGEDINKNYSDKTDVPMPGNSFAKRDKKAENAAETARKKALSEFEKLDDEYKKLNLQRLNDQLSNNEKEVKQEADKYDALIKKEQDFLKMKGATPQQKKTTQENIKSIEADKEKAIIDLRVRQETQMVERIEALHVQLTAIHETEYQKQLNQINKFYDEQERLFAGNEAALARLKAGRSKEIGDAELREAERLATEKADIESRLDPLINGDTKKNRLAAINKRYDDEILALKAKFSKEIQLTQSFQDAIASIEKNRKAEIDKTTGESNQWTKDNTIEAAQSAADSVFTIMQNNRQAALNASLSAIEKQRTSELDNKNLTEEQKQKINEKYDAQVRSEKLRAWKADKAAALAQAVINGALSVTKALPNIPLAVISGIAAAAQIAVITAEKPPEFAEGGMSNETPAGYVGRATVFNNSASGRPFVAGERGREWIAPNWMVNDPRYANIIGTLEVARREKRAFATGGFNGASPGAAAGSFTRDPEITRLAVLVSAMAEEQRRFNALPTVIEWKAQEEYAKKLQNDRVLQMS